MMFNVPVIGGSTGHAVGRDAHRDHPRAVGGVHLGVDRARHPGAALRRRRHHRDRRQLSSTWRVVMPFVGYYLYRLIAGDTATTRRKVVASGIAVVRRHRRRRRSSPASSSASSRSSRTPPPAQPLYAPYPLAVAVPAMAIEHLLFFGWVEAFATMGVVAALAKQDSALLDDEAGGQTAALAVGGVRACSCCSRRSACSRKGTAWGEWGAEQLEWRRSASCPRDSRGSAALWTRGDARLRAGVHPEPAARLPRSRRSWARRSSSA